MKQEPQSYDEDQIMKDYPTGPGVLKQEPHDEGFEEIQHSEVNKMMNSNSQLHQQMSHQIPQMAHQQHHQPLPHHQQSMQHPQHQMPQHPIPQHPQQLHQQHPHPHHHPHMHPHAHPHAHPHPHGHPHAHPHLHHPHVMQGGSIIKYEMQEDPYSFVDEERHAMQSMQCPPVVMQQVPKKRGRKKKVKPEDQQLQMHGG